jgi:DNA-binding NarL/FixJ family response regulator
VSQTLQEAPPSRPDGVSGVRETTVLIVDDHRSFADLLEVALGSVPTLRCLGTASSAAEGLRLVQQLRPSVVVMDIQMPGTDGLAATRQLRRASPNTAVAVITAHRDGEWVARAAQAGASAFIPKNGSLAEMIQMLVSAKPGPMAVAPSVLPTSRHRSGAGQEPECHLTERELQVLGLMAQALPTKSIARVLGISTHTCRGYVKTIYVKLGANSRISAVNRGHELHLLQDPPA